MSTESTRTSRVAVIGTGLVGRAWAIVFARAGLDVVAYDPTAGAVDAALARIDEALPGLAAVDLLGGQDTGAVRARMTAAASLGEALDGVGHVQESGPEDVAVKRAIYAELDRVAHPDTVLASSTSGIPASSFTEPLDGRGRCLVAHPINPPHIVPLVEIVPAPWTAPETVERTRALMARVGQSPIELGHEVKGFVVNRLQGALLAEAFRLVDDGVCSVADVDAAIADGLGLRWSFIGPFETIDLNSPRGVPGYCDMLGPLYLDLQREAEPREWDEALVARIDAERRERLAMADHPARQAWRDDWLARLVGAKRAIAKDLGR